MTPKTARTAFIIFFMALVAAFLYMAAPLMKGAFLAFVIAVLFYPLYLLILRIFRQHNYLTAVVTAVICFAIVLLPLSLVIILLVTKLVGFVTGLAAEIQSGQFDPIIQSAGQTIDRWMAMLPGGSDMTVDLRNAILTGVREAGAFLYQFSPHVLAKTAGFAFDVVILAIFLVVFFAEGANLFAWLIQSLPMSASYQREISRDIRTMISALLLGMIGTALAQGLLIGLGIWIAGFTNALMWGVIAILAAFIPIVGAALGYLGATAVLAAMGRWEAATAFFIYGIAIVSSVDNVLRPMLMGSRVRVHPILLFIALLGGVRLFGAIGVIAGPVLLAVFLASLRIYKREFAAIEAPDHRHATNTAI
ncbi:MAG: AI-2E family transporter [bacterium]